MLALVAAVRRQPVRSAALLAALAVAALALVLAPGRARSANVPVSDTVTAQQPVYLVHEGDTAHPVLVLTTSNGQPLDHAVTVNYATGATLTVGNGTAARRLPSTANPGHDYTPASGSITFPAGSPSGSTRSIAVSTIGGRPPAKAKTINIALSSADPASSVGDQPPTVVIDAHGLPYLDASLPIAQRVSDLVKRMTLAEKVGQMTQGDRYMFTDSSASSNTSIDNIRAWDLGSVLSGAGDTPTPNTPTGWADMVDSFESQARATPLQIPLIYGEDSVHGDGNMMGATVFPHNIGMGATRDPALAQREGAIAAQETRATGPQWAFAPCLCVARDDRWGRTYESFGEDPALVTRMEPVINGLQGTRAQAARSGQSTLDSPDHVLATAKHFAGDGGTTYGTGDSGYPIDQGETITSSATFQRLYVSPYVAAVHTYHVGSVMPSYSSVVLDGASCPTKMSADRHLLTGVLKHQIGFKGFVISDYNAINEIGDSRSCPIPSPLPAGVPDTYSYQIEVSANAGMDMFMAPSAYQQLETDLTTLIQNGVVPMSRVNDAVSRVLTQKFELGLFEHPFTNRSGQSQIGDAAHRAVAARAAAESQVLLKNAHHVLPISRTAHVYVAGSNADNLGSQTGGWTLTWQGQPGPIDDPGTTILQGIEAKDSHVTYSPTASAPTHGSNVGIVVVGEHPYAEGEGDVGQTGYAANGDIANLDLTPADQAAVHTVCAAMRCAVLIVSGRPMTITDQLPQMDALVASWLPGTEGEGVADALFGTIPFSGQLPQSWPRTLDQEPINVGDASYDPLYPFGWGLHTTSARADARHAEQVLRVSGDSASAAKMSALVHTSADWRSDGSAKDPAAVFGALRSIAYRLSGRHPASFAVDEAVAAVARSIAETAMMNAGGPTQSTSVPFAGADHALLSGNLPRAINLLAQAAS